jgi:hypothetical protein
MPVPVRNRPSGREILDTPFSAGGRVLSHAVRPQSARLDGTFSDFFKLVDGTVEALRPDCFQEIAFCRHRVPE